MVVKDIFKKFIEDGSAAAVGMLNESFEYKAPSRFSTLLSTLSRYGMSYDEDVYRNMKAVPADKMLQTEDDDPLLQASLYNQTLNYKVKSEEDKPFKEKTLDQKRQVLRKMAMQPELEDILDIMANEAIVYDDEDVYICKPYIDNAVIQDLNEKALNEIRSCVDTVFYKMYLLCDWKNDAWNSFRRWLIDGDLAYEIIYDDINNPHTIIGIVDLDPATLTREVKNGITYWIQYKGVLGHERLLLDAQVIYIKYEDSGVVERQSYLERIIRPFNIYRIIEQAQIIWTVTQSSFKTMFTIPVQGMNRAKGQQTLAAAMNRYKEDISFNGDTGELKVNGKMMLPFTREYFMPETENGKPELETLTDAGPDLANSEQLKFFEARLYKQSKIPGSRFDKEMQATWFGTDPSQALRDEINFSRFITRLMNVFSQILLKPIQIQVALQMPELKNDKRILNAIGLRFNSYNQFVELMEQQIDMTRIEHIQALRDTFMTTDAEGNEERFFCDKFLIMKYLKMSDADLELNEKLKIAEANKKKASEEGGEEGSEDGGGEGDSLDDELGLNGDDEGGSEEETPEADEGDEIDQEMMGDVTPEEGGE